MEVSCGTPFSAAEVHVVIFMANCIVFAFSTAPIN